MGRLEYPRAGRDCYWDLFWSRQLLEEIEKSLLDWGSWGRLLGWLTALVLLHYGVCSFLESLVRLPSWAELGNILSNRLGYKLASLSRQSGKGPKANTVCSLGT